MPAAYSVDPEDFALLSKVLAATARAGGLFPDDAEEFCQWAHLKLLERNYAPLAQFSGRSSLRTYLTVVARRLLLDWRNERYGKWRPSAWARQHGASAVQLDRLVTRDGHTKAEALAILQQQGRCDPASLAELGATLPARHRARTVSLDGLPDIAPVAEWTDPIERAENEAEMQSRKRRLQQALSELAPSDWHLLRLRFQAGMSIVRIADLLKAPPKPLYRRMQRVLTQLRRRLAVAAPISTRRGATAGASDG